MPRGGREPTVAPTTSRSRIARAAHRLILRTARTPLRRLWPAAYALVARAVTAYVGWGERGAAAYARGGLADGDLVPGLSDVDTAVVLAPDPAGAGIAGRRARRRWRRLAGALPSLGLLVDGPVVCEQPELDRLSGSSALTYGLDEPRAPAVRHPDDFRRGDADEWVRMVQRPGLYADEVCGWRPLAGPDRRPPGRARDRQACRIAAWLELCFWWRYAFGACVDPSRPRTAALCVKLVAEPVRVWLWLAHGVRISGRAEVLRAGLRRLPEEELAMRRALELHAALTDLPDPPLDEVMAALVRITARTAELIRAEVGDRGATEVSLRGGDPPELIMPAAARPPAFADGGRDGRLLPLADWRGLVWPLTADEAMAPLPGDPGDPAAVGAAAVALREGAYPALRGSGLIAMPAVDLFRSRLRAVQCPSTDPVSFALLGGNSVASFPEVRGWSAADSARRAVAEHRARLQAGESAGGDGPRFGNGDALAMLLTAARAGLFAESLRDGGPELALTATETARRLAERSPPARSAAETALGGLRDFSAGGAEPPGDAVAALRAAVLALPPYAERESSSVRRASQLRS